MEGKPTRIRVKNVVHRIRPIPRKLIFGGLSLTIAQALSRKGGLIVGEGDTGKTTYVQMLYEAAKERDRREPILVKLRTRPRLEIPAVPEGEVQTIIWDGLDEFPECAHDIVDLTDGLDPERYHVWVTSRPGNAASIVAGSMLVEQVYHLAPFTTDDICEIARSVGLDGTAFISRVCDAHLESFIAKPGGAVILMQLFANGKLDQTGGDDNPTGSNLATGPSGVRRTAVMETIMRDFASETRDGDVEAVPNPTHDEQKIVEATGWIAACLVFSGRDAIWTGSASNCPANDIRLEDLPPRNYGTNLFKAAIGLRLFEPLTQTRYRLAYSEMSAFLAGRWLAMNLPVEKLRELPLHPKRCCDADESDDSYAEMSLQVEPIDAIVWACAYDSAFSKPYIRKYPSMFLKFHSLIEDVGFPDFFRSLCEEVFFVDDNFDPYAPHWYSLEPVSDLAGYTAFANFLQNVIDSGTYEYRYEFFAPMLLSACNSKPRCLRNAPSSSRDKDELIDIPTERELAQRLSNPMEIDADEVMKLVKAERIRGFPYMALQEFFKNVVFRLQNEDERLVRPDLVGCALIYDAKQYLKHVAERLPSDVANDPQIKIILSRAHDDDGEDYEEEFEDETPFSPEELDALAPMEPKPVSAIVVGSTEAACEELAQAVVEKTKNKGGAPSKAAGFFYSQSKIAEMFGPPCTTDMVANWERYVRTEGQAGSAPPSATYPKDEKKPDGEQITVIYTSELRKYRGADDARALAALFEQYKSAQAVKQRMKDEKVVHFKSEESLYRMRNPDGKVRTSNPEGTY